MPQADLYDVVPYPSAPLDQTHPDRLATIGRLYGLKTAAPERCRYLELGCGSGMNLLCMAALLPQAQFLGIDLASEPISIAQGHAAELQLTNVVFAQGDITTLETMHALGEYDYIVAHGVYSWVPAPVREALLRVCAGHLAEHGVAYISYNTMPGGHVRQMVREMMRYHVREIAEPVERLEQGRSLIHFLIDAKAGPPLYGPLLQPELDHLDHASPGLLFHDDLADINQPVYFHEFVAQAQGHALQFLAEAELEAMQELGFSAAVRATLAQMPNDLIAREQYSDFLTCRRFRQSLLCRAGRTLERSITPLATIPTLRFVSNAKLTATGQEPVTNATVWTYTREPRTKLTTKSAHAHLVMDILMAAWPQAVGFDDLLTHVAPAAGPDLNARLLAQLLLELGCFGIVDMRSWMFPAANAISAHPRVSQVARWQAARGPDVAALNHVMVKLDGGLLRQLVQLLDGTRTVAEVVDALTRQVQAGTIKAPPQLDIRDATAVRASIVATMPASLNGLRRLPLLDA